MTDPTAADPTAAAHAAGQPGTATLPADPTAAPTPPHASGAAADLIQGHGGVLASVQPDLPSSLVSAAHSMPLAYTDPTIPSAGSNLVAAAADPMTGLAKGVADAAAAALKALADVWANPPSPGLGAFRADGTVEPSAAVGLLQGSLAWYTAAVAVVAVLVAAGRMAWQHRGQPLFDLLRGLGTLVLVSGAGLTTVTLCVGAADAFSAWILARVTPDVGGSLTSMLALPGKGDVPVVLLTFLDGAVMVGAVLQVVLLIGRGVVLVLLTGLLPLSASATSTDTGRAVFCRMLAWLAAFVLYQPLAASIYAVSFLVSPDPKTSPVQSTITGAASLLLALVALPALLRILRPVMTAALGTRRGSEVGRTLPTGARAVAPLTLSSPSGRAVVVTGAATVLSRTAGTSRLPRAAGPRPLERAGSPHRPRAITAGEPSPPPPSADPEEPIA